MTWSSGGYHNGLLELDWMCFAFCWNTGACPPLLNSFLLLWFIYQYISHWTVHASLPRDYPMHRPQEGRVPSKWWWILHLMANAHCSLLFFYNSCFVGRSQPHDLQQVIKVTNGVEAKKKAPLNGDQKQRCVSAPTQIPAQVSRSFHTWQAYYRRYKRRI